MIKSAFLPQGIPTQVGSTFLLNRQNQSVLNLKNQMHNSLRAFMMSVTSGLGHGSIFVCDTISVPGTGYPYSSLFIILIGRSKPTGLEVAEFPVERLIKRTTINYTLTVRSNSSIE